MFWKIVFCAAFVAILAPCRVEAQQSIYGQCGGVGWSGPTSCVAGCTCSAENPYYAQCLSGGPTPSPTPQTASTTLVTTTNPPVVTYTPATTSLNAPSGTGSGSGSGSGPVAGNPFAGYQIYANPYYASEISASAIPSMTGAAAAAASAVAEVGVFFWLDTAAKVPYMDTFLEDIQTMNAAGASPSVMGAFVVYDLPDRDCAAAASNGEYSIADNGVANYFAYIDSIAASVKAYPEVNIAFIIEPDSLANLVTNLGVAKCAEAQSAYLQCVNYAITTLNLPNVAMYLDAGHAGWLGWPANLGPAATLFAQVYKNASSPSQLRGLATNVANYNAWSLSGNQPQPSYTAGDPNYDEQLYVNALAPLVAAAGWPNAHFVTDTSRNGVQPTSQLAWGDFCNVVGTGFGVRPTTNTGSPELVDAFLWIKPGGECDGTSNTSSARYDFHCGLPDALQPAPEAGTWFQAYFAQLVENANPSF